MTVKDIFDLSMSLMDEKKDNKNMNKEPESDYETNPDYIARTPGILTILQTQVITFLRRFGQDIDYNDPLKTMDDEVELEDSICQEVLPYGLAARLLGQEDRYLSSYFSDLYNSNLNGIKDALDDKYIAEQVERENVYGLFRAGD